ncbi:MAG: choice-of-anchor Q domain-containing protein, partial [Candidatus Diapherotrites archaeon]|nr:choice-of-anchor Q domain-containing protein [Candidatus Diapherotrites archaeon]
FFASFAFSTSWYVSPTGNNTTGNSWANAWTSLNFTGKTTINPGDTIFIDGGSSSLSYAALTTGKAGTASQRITIARSQESGRNGIVYIDSMAIKHPYITVDGRDRDKIIVPAAGGYTIDLQDAALCAGCNGDFFELKNVFVKGDFSGAWGTSLYIRVPNATISNSTFEKNSAEDMIKYAGGGTVTMQDSIFIHNVGPADGKHRDVFQVENNNYSLNVYRNIFWDTGDIFMLDAHLGPLGNFNFAYNVFVSNGDVFKPHNYTSIGAVKFHNNVFKGPARLLGNWDGRNNIISGQSWSTGEPRIYPDLTGANNLYDSTITTPGYVSGIGNFQGDPKFINPSSPLGADGIPFTADDGFNIQSGSPAINNGASLGYSTDIRGNAISGTPDIGAYEFQAVPSNVFYIRAGSSCTSSCGNDWTTAFPSLAAAKAAGTGGRFTRGATYYVAVGNYTAVALDTAQSGISVITIKGATIADHNIATGWSNAFSVCSAEGGTQAQFPSGWDISTNYWTIDGSCGAGSANNGTTTGYGFRSRSDATGSGAVGFTFDNDVSGITISHYEIDGVNATNLPITLAGPHGMLCVGGCAFNGLLDHLYIHDIKGAGFLMGGTATLQYSYLARNRSTAPMHAEGWASRTSSVILRWNIFEDIRGTGQFVQLYGTGTNHEVYGNVFKLVEGPCATECGSTAFPVIDNTSTGTINGLKFYNNTIYGFNANPGVASINGSTGYDVKNNLWINNSYGASIAGTENYNNVWGTYWYSGGPTGAQSYWRCIQYGGSDPSGNCAGNNSLVAPSASAIFVSVPGNLHVLGNTISGLTMIGTNLGAPYDVDMEGNTRTNWTRGAYEFTGASPPEDTIPPVTTASPLGGTYAGTQSITLSRNESGITYYCLGSGCAPSMTYSSAISISSSNILRYYSVDAASNSETVKQQVYTITAPDTTAPSVPSGLSAAAASSSQINLSWIASSDNVAVTGYNVYRGGVNIGSSATTSFQNAGLSPSTTYNYKVSAFDAANNESAQSAQASATTPAQPSGNCALTSIRCVGSGQEYSTISAALTASVAGDTVLAYPGNYTGAGIVNISKSGTSLSKITIKSETKQQAFVTGFNINGSNLIIDGFDITNNGGNGDGIDFAGNNIEIVNNYIHDIGKYGIIGDGDGTRVSQNHLYQTQIGIVVDGSNYLVENNDIEKQIDNAYLGDCDYTRFFGTNGVFRGNYMHGTASDIIDVTTKCHVDCFQTFGSGAQNMLFEKNFCTDSHEAVIGNAYTGSLHSDWIIRNNVFIDIVNSIIVIQDTQNVKVYNNVIGTVKKPTIYFVWYRANTTGDVRNNIIYSGFEASASWQFTAENGGTFTQGTNLFYGITPAKRDASDITGQNPLFADSANLDFHLQSASPAINNGTAIAGFSEDYDRVSRPQGTAWDIGAFEYTGVAPPRTCFDLTNDSKVDVFDLVFVALRIGNATGDPADVKDNDGVNISDLQEVAANFGQAC